MNAAGQTICLSMIVKNEAPVIRRCLHSVRSVIDHWVVVDTGSTDGTPDIVREHFKDLPGELHERPWRDFAHNRSEALTLARPHAGYSLIIDADDALEIPDGFQVPELMADSYMLDILDTNIRYERMQLVRNALPWCYRGVLHEFLSCEGSGPAGRLSIAIRRNHDGARRRDCETYVKDAAILENALLGETDPFLVARYTFYLAQSYRDCGQKEKAIECYLRRAGLGYWPQEVFVSLYEAAQIKEGLGHDFDDVIALYLRASDAAPDRAEALHGASQLCRNRGRNQQGYEIAKRGLALAAPADGLFVHSWIYDHGLLDEFSVNAYWAGHYRECLDASLKILATGQLSGPAMQRVVANARFATEHLPCDPDLGSLGKDDFAEQHTLMAPRAMRTRLDNPPRVLMAILAKQKEPSLPLYLECIEALDYPKSSIVLYIRTNNNTDRTELILREWIARVGHLYAEVEFDAENVATPVEQFGVHEWNATRFRVLGRIRNISTRRAKELDCDFYFVSDVDNFIRPCTLRELVALNLPIVAPMLRSIDPISIYSNYHAEIDANGYYMACDQYQLVLRRQIRGVVEMPVIHTTYLIRTDVIDDLTYEDASDRFEYVVFSDSARKADIPQYLDNRQVYGYITFAEGGIGYVANGFEKARRLMRGIEEKQAECAEIKSVLALLTPRIVADFKKIRIGHDGDGGYVMLDDFHHEMVCFSLGVAGEISWDLDLASRGALIYQYDDSIDAPPVSHPNFRFRRLRIDPEDNPERNLIRLDTIMASCPEAQRGCSILNMDIEGSEWNVLNSLDASTLGAFSQIIVEFHGLASLEDRTFRESARSAFSTILQTHFPIHLHGNNWQSLVEFGSFDCPEVIEVTFVRKDVYAGAEKFASYPTALDRPCRSDRPDLSLARFPFVFVD